MVGIGKRMFGKQFSENQKFNEKMTILPVDHHDGQNIGPIVFLHLV